MPIEDVPREGGGRRPSTTRARPTARGPARSTSTPTSATTRKTITSSRPRTTRACPAITCRSAIAAGAARAAAVPPAGRLHRLRRGLGALLRAAGQGGRLLPGPLQRLRPPAGRDAARHPAGGRHRPALTRSGRASRWCSSSTTTRRSTRWTCRPRPTATSSGPARRWRYKIGQLKILELRERAKQALGDRFDIRGFHDEVLGAGALPLDVLEARIDAWIAGEKAGKAATAPASQ